MLVLRLTVFVILTMSLSVDFVHAGSWFSVGEWGPRHWFREVCAWLGWCNEICFDDLGCFTDELECHKNFFPPMGPEEIVTSFTLFTRKHGYPYDVGEPLKRLNTSQLHRSSFRANKKTVFIIHGWGEDRNKDWVQELKKAILEREKTNVILVDWQEGADELNYWKSVQNIRVVGREMAMFIGFLYDYTGVDPSQIHLIGHSLGSHVAGYAGQDFPGIGRITDLLRFLHLALDAAGPSFEGTEEGCRLDKSDAMFVDAVHTDSAANGAGISQTIGHRDFYPNGGYSQPGCRWWQFICDHARAVYYYIESIHNRNCGFRGVPCESEDAFAKNLCSDCGNSTCPRMGYFSNTNHDSSGKFYLYTESTFPYCAKRRRYSRLYRKWRGNPSKKPRKGIDAS
ncbi:Pancreatic triacylglycerol lipase [Holothuria leucospilota]|uniref:Pancreatic triacylglycerol lipase n=1 Tax=Holothuria leucospilota TaxID=206669 RepID=A0A9Q1CAB7_HOLLE|nr:Pancreatic triacylglycerol lipase [Holothuria leucospilota]